MSDNQKLGVAIVSDQLGGFPQGYAGAQCVRLLASGLSRAGANATVVATGMASAGSTPRPASGDLEGFRFEHTAGTAVASRYWTLRFIQRIRARWNLPWRLGALRREGRLDAIMMYSRSKTLLIELLRISAVLKIPVVVHMVEWPPACGYLPIQQRKAESAFYELAFERADGFVVISGFLDDACRDGMKQYGRERPILRLPVVMDPSEWDGVCSESAERPYLLYCAQLDNYASDALLILNAFAAVHERDVDLVYVGQASAATRERLREEAGRLGIGSQLRIATEYVSRTRLRSLYTGASALLAPLSDDEQSRARFPGKISDYLMSGRPVVSSRVGEVARYLADGESAFLATPDGAESFAQKIAEALHDPRREEIAKAGRAVALEAFDYRVQGGRLADFLAQVSGERAR